MNWTKLTNDQVLEAWHDATVAHQTATGNNLDNYMRLKLQGEAEAIRRFGLGNHVKAYDDRFPDG